MYLPRADALEGGEVPDSEQPAVAGGEEVGIVGAESESSDGLAGAVDGVLDGGVGGVDDVDFVVAGADEKGGIGGDGVRAARVETLQRGHAAVVLL